MNISIVADYVTVFTCIISTVVLVSASVSKKARVWMKSIFLECLDELPNKDVTSITKKDGDHEKDNKKDGDSDHIPEP